jgi:hypothetical protein
MSQVDRHLYFTAILDYNYLGRLKALFDSMRQHHKNFTLFIVCLDDKLYQYLSRNKLPDTETIRLDDIEQFYPELIEVKKVRAAIDYIFTLSPYYPSYILENYKEIPFICSLDVDQYFFSSAESIFKELQSCSVLITPHRFTKKITHFERYGLYNVSFQIFKNDHYGCKCLKIWREQCLAWCKDEWEENKFADQKYLETWAEYLGDKVQAISNPGLGLAPWNIENYKLAVQNNKIYVDQHALILFHYQGLRFLKNNLINSGLAHYNAAVTKLIQRRILQPIIVHLSKASLRNAKDQIPRYAVQNGGGLLNQLNSKGFFYLMGDRLISMDNIFFLNNQRKRISGLLNRFKNIYRQTR